MSFVAGGSVTSEATCSTSWVLSAPSVDSAPGSSPSDKTSEVRAGNDEVAVCVASCSTRPDAGSATAVDRSALSTAAVVMAAGGSASPAGADVFGRGGSPSNARALSMPSAIASPKSAKSAARSTFGNNRAGVGSHSGILRSYPSSTSTLTNGSTTSINASGTPSIRSGENSGKSCVSKK